MGSYDCGKWAVIHIQFYCGWGVLRSFKKNTVLAKLKLCLGGTVVRGPFQPTHRCLKVARKSLACGVFHPQGELGHRKVAIGCGPPFGVYLGLVFVWGLAGGFFITMSRTLFLAAAPPDFRGRILSVQGLALLGMAPMSNLAAGLLAEAIGPHATFLAAGGLMAGILWLTSRVTGVAKFDSRGQP